jgi:hypothetical protein
MRSHDTGKARACSAPAKARVKAVNAIAKPITMPTGLSFPPPIDVERRIGSTIRTQGDAIVSIPARNATIIRVDMF